MNCSRNGEETTDYIHNGAGKRSDRHILVGKQDDGHNLLGKMNRVPLPPDLQHVFDVCLLELEPSLTPLLRMFGIWDASKHQPSMLSSLSRVLCFAPRCLLPLLPEEETTK